MLDIVRVICFHEKNIDYLSGKYHDLKLGLLFRNKETGFQEGISIGSDQIKDGTAKTLQEISDMIKDKDINISISMQDELILNSKPEEIKEFIESVGPEREIGFWQIADKNKSSQELNLNMIKCQRKLKQSGHIGICNLITDNKEELENLYNMDN